MVGEGVGGEGKICVGSFLVYAMKVRCVKDTTSNVTQIKRVPDNVQNSARIGILKTVIPLYQKRRRIFGFLDRQRLLIIG